MAPCLSQNISCAACTIEDSRDLAALAEADMGVMCDPSCLEDEGILLCNALGLVSRSRESATVLYSCPTKQLTELLFRWIPTLFYRWDRTTLSSLEEAD